MNLRALVGCLIIFILVLDSGCTSAKKRETERNRRQIHQIVPYTLRVRRPPGPGAHPTVGPGGVDYQSDPLPNERFDCEDVPWLFKDVDLVEARACLTSLTSTASVLYRLKRVDAPYLEIDAVDETPSCLVSALPKIPLPREFFFQSNEEGQLRCYGTRLDIEADEIAGLKMPRNRLALRIDLPLAQAPLNDKETRLLLLSWVLTPFWENDGHYLPSKIMPDHLCNACLGEKERVKDTDPPPTLWP